MRRRHLIAAGATVGAVGAAGMTATAAGTVLGHVAAATPPVTIEEYVLPENNRPHDVACAADGGI